MSQQHSHSLFVSANPAAAAACPEPFSAEELAGARKLRERLTAIDNDADDEEQLQLLPDLCTEFGLARCWRAARGDLAEAEHRVRHLNAHMRAFGMDRLEHVLCTRRGIGQPCVQRVYECFAISRLQPPDVFSDQLLVFLQRMDGVDIKQMLRAIPLGHILLAYFRLQLNWMRAIHAHEQKTGRPAAAVVIIDLRGLSIRDFVNPLSPASRMARSIVRIWSEYFTENLVRLYLVHPPGLLSILWQVAKHIMDQRTWSKMVVIQKGDDLLDHLQAAAVPQAYGGQRRDDSGFCAFPTSCVSTSRPVPAARLYVNAESLWARMLQSTMATNAAGMRGDGAPAMEMPKWQHATLLGGNHHQKGATGTHCESQPIDCEPGDHLHWMFTSNGELQFELVCAVQCATENDGDKNGQNGVGNEEQRHENNANTNNNDQSPEQQQKQRPKKRIVPVWPKCAVASLAVPEHGTVECRWRGRYWARFAAVPSAGTNAAAGWLMSAFGGGHGTKVSYIVQRQQASGGGAMPKNAGNEEIKSNNK